MKHWLSLVVVALVFLSGVAAYHVFTHTVHASMGYCLEARFETLPPDDEPLKAWLRAQPGIVPHTVAVGRFDPDEKLLVVMFTQVRNLANEPPLPDLDAACQRLGYGQPDGRFRDSEDRERVFPYP